MSNEGYNWKQDKATKDIKVKTHTKNRIETIKMTWP